jgi:hypothetical protein
MLSHAIENRETHDAIEHYVMAAIVDAREVYNDEKWLTWADHWIAGRDRSFASARTAHRMARQACDRESAKIADRSHDCLQSGDEEFGPAETPVEMAAWAAGLALVTAPVAPDLAAAIRRIEFSLRSRLARLRTAQHVRWDARPEARSVARSGRPSLAGRAIALARRAASTLLPSEVPEAARL